MSLEEVISKNTVVIETQNRLLKAILAKLAGGTAIEPQPLLAEDQVSTPKPKKTRAKKEEKAAPAAQPVVPDQGAPKAVLAQGPVEAEDDNTTAPAEPEVPRTAPAPAPAPQAEELNAFSRWYAAPKGELTLDVIREGMNKFFQTMNERTGDSSEGVKLAKQELAPFGVNRVSELSDANRLVYLMRLNGIATGKQSSSTTTN